MSCDIKVIDNDITFDRHRFSLTENTEKIMQHLKIRLQFFLGEWFLNTRIGVPYYQHVLTKGITPVRLKSIFKRTILETPGVAELLEFRLTQPKPRQLQLNFTVKTSNGDIHQEVLNV